MSERICPECGSDIWRAANYNEVEEARARHHRKNQEQALEILRLQLRVAELEDWRRTRNRKIEMQRRTIRRLEEKLRKNGQQPHDNKPLGEGDPASPVGAISPPPAAQEPTYPSPRGLRLLKRRKEKT